MQDQLDRFEQVLEDGLVKLCKSAGMLDDLISSPDIDEKWEEFIKDYVADAVENINEYPNAAIGFAAFLGMGVAYHWDRDWQAHKDDHYNEYYGTKGFDNMDDHILQEVMQRPLFDAEHISNMVYSCVQATLALLRHEKVELQTEYGFYALARCYSVMFRMGEALELRRLGYKKEYQSNVNIN